MAEGVKLRQSHAERQVVTDSKTIEKEESKFLISLMVMYNYNLTFISLIRLIKFSYLVIKLRCTSIVTVFESHT